MVIRVLRPEVVSKIAAGEVVERPFSVLKELIENSLDAGATRIVIELEEGGRSLIRVRDDGCGIEAEDLGLAFVQHATSKLADVEDLDAIASLGFRGEALASIGSVSRARILSRRRGAEAGHELRCEGGAIGEVRPAPSGDGTLVEVRDLFFNVPARRRFLRTPAAERARCLEILTRLALAHPEVGFTLEGQKGLRLEPGEDLRERVARLFGRELAGASLPVSHERGGITVQGLAADPDEARRDRSGQHVFVNGRPIQDRSLTHAIEEPYREYLMGGRRPVVFLFLSMDPGRVDVNVHPTKSEVRFAEGRLVYSAVRGAVLAALQRRASRLRSAGIEAGAGTDAAPRPATGFPELPAGLFGHQEGPARDVAGVAERPPGGRIVPVAEKTSPATNEPEPRSSPFRAGVRFLVARNLYIVFETDDGIAVVDQHALHERVVYEQMLTAWRAGSVPIQRLLLPAVLDLPPADKELLLEHAETLARGGLPIADFGGNAIKLEGYPTALRRVDPQALVASVVAGLRDGGDVSEPEEVRERFHSAACRSAVMAGDRLSEQEIEDLLRAAAELEHPHNCPHGRPTVIQWTAAELERFFKRRV